MRSAKRPTKAHASAARPLTPARRGRGALCRGARLLLKPAARGLCLLRRRPLSAPPRRPSQAPTPSACGTASGSSTRRIPPLWPSTRRRSLPCRALPSAPPRRQPRPPSALRPAWLPCPSFGVLRLWRPWLWRPSLWRPWLWRPSLWRVLQRLRRRPLLKADDVEGLDVHAAVGAERDLLVEAEL